MKATVIDEHGPLHRETFVFELTIGYNSPARLCLREYRDERRASTRHKFKPETDRHYSRDFDWRSLRFHATDVPLTELIVDRAKTQFRAQIDDLPVLIETRKKGDQYFKESIWQNSTTVI